MKQDDIFLSDVTRLVFGQQPPAFLSEVLFRAVLSFIIIIITLRLLGRRVASQYTLIELSAVITLAGTMGVPLLDDKRGLLPPLLIICGLVGMQHLMGHLSLRFRKLDRALAGTERIALEDGRLRLETLRNTVLSREKLFSLLRGRGVQQLGQLSRVYIEPSGALTLVWSDTPRPGLAIVPRHDKALLAEMRNDDHQVCASCGNLTESQSEPDLPCRCCHARNWLPAATALED
ncbi:DUF421 domain-containing protein [Pantoea sp. LMR881]|uniref:DUF421 domain-containing protein n=1 Tax=Pantoea sp. LMR881 TaxID=3014336 RepID=UPI0022AE9BE3|nr:YetF domain-containing protein [Pantoea sp. LMR881]MCZ4058238.1 DUF421 domain-containing protein [Pantoea sp. LMR881]